jgi:hypothetical protein
MRWGYGTKGTAGCKGEDGSKERGDVALRGWGRVLLLENGDIV